MLADLREKTARLLPQIRGIRAVPMSGETGDGLGKLMDAILDTHRVWNQRISTAKLNKWLEGILAHHPPPAARWQHSRRGACRSDMPALSRPHRATRNGLATVATSWLGRSGAREGTR